MNTSSILTPQILRPLVLEYLSTTPSGQVHGVVSGMIELAYKKKIIGYELLQHFPRDQRGILFDAVQMIMWQLLPQGVLVWGMGGDLNDTYPFYRLTQHGKNIVANASEQPQPYDPDGFIKEFTRVVPLADVVILDYLTEAVRAFNAACYKSAAVMLGAASEKAVLLLHGTFGKAIVDSVERKKFENDSGGTSVARKFNALKERLDRMVDAKKFKSHHELIETIRHALPAVSELIRRCRNDAGHPDIPTPTDSDTVFLNIRVFTEHARRIYGLLAYFQSNPAEW